MSDMLVKLYELPDITPVMNKMQQQNITVRPALAPELHLISSWVKDNFSAYWESEVRKSFSNTPISCYIAIKEGKLFGFACYDATLRGFFGPMGVSESSRGIHVGKALLLYTLAAQKNMGYGYSIIGGVGPHEFYQKHVGAIAIPNSSPGVYQGMLR